MVIVVAVIATIIVVRNSNNSSEQQVSKSISEHVRKEVMHGGNDMQ